jgi:hypothetical protein
MRLVVLFLSLLLASASFAQTQAQQPTEQPAAATNPADTTPVPAPETSSDDSMMATEDEPVAPAVNLAMPEGVLTNFNLTYYSRKLEDPAGPLNDTFNSLQGEIKVGYLFDFGLFAGVQGHYGTGKASNNTIKTYYAGPTIGYSCNYTGLFVSATYHVIGNSDLDTLGEYDKVSGLQLDFAYPMMLTESLKFGPQLSWRDMKNSDSATLGDVKTKELVPFMGLWFIF